MSSRQLRVSCSVLYKTVGRAEGETGRSSRKVCAAQISEKQGTESVAKASLLRLPRRIHGIKSCSVFLLTYLPSSADSCRSASYTGSESAQMLCRCPDPSQRSWGRSLRSADLSSCRAYIMLAEDRPQFLSTKKPEYGTDMLAQVNSGCRVAVSGHLTMISPLSTRWEVEGGASGVRR